MWKLKHARTIQYVLLALLVLAALRVFFIYRERHAGLPEKPKQAALPLPPEAYVVPKKLYISTVKSARQELPKQPVWIKEGYRFTYYPVSGAAVDFQREAGTLGPIEKIQITDVLTAPLAHNPNRQVIAVFNKDGRRFGVPIGSESGGEATIFADDIFFYEDPHELFHFWPADVWDAIGRHEIRKGMNEWQAAFAVGMGTPQPGGDTSQKTVVYPNAGKPVTATFQDGKVVDVKQGS